MLNRRTFLTSLAAGVTGMGMRLPVTAERLSIAFSTLGCPGWDWSTILRFAGAHGFAGIELRGLLGEMDLSRVPEFAPARIDRTRAELAERNLRVLSLGSSANMHEAEPAKRAVQSGEARRFIDLAHALDAPYVRVFGNNYVEGEPRAQTIVRIARTLRALGDYAGERDVTVLLESHGDFTDSPTLLRILELADSPRVALLWDAHHTFVSSHEPPEDTFRQLGKYIRHTHLKDSVPDGKGGRRYVLTGAGEVPVKRQVEILAAGGYPGFYCFEWEKRWHPEIEDPEVAFPHFARIIRQYLGAS
jgi:sugar phosphate isomerase/epimerase